MSFAQKKEFPALTGIRFVAASLVFLFHYAHELLPDRSSFGYYFFRQLNVGVNIFFVLSGLLIAHRYFDLRISRKQLRAYIIKRVARIFPLYYAVLFVQLLLMYVHRHSMPDALTVFLNITLLKGLGANYFYSVLTQSWSLTVEEMFYFYAPFCFYLIKAKNFFLAQIPLLIGVGLLLVYLSSSFIPNTFFDDREFLFAGTFFGRCFEFFAGIFVALIIRKSAIKRSGMVFTMLGAILFLLLLFSLAYFAFNYGIGIINDHFVGIVLFNFLIPASIALFFYGLITEESTIKQALGTKAFALLGKSSYAFYLLHIGMIAEVLFFKITSNILLLFVLLQLLSVAVYKLFEKPVYFLILRKFSIQPLSSKSVSQGLAHT